MKKTLFFVMLVLFCFNVNAQDENGQTAKNSWMIEVNTGFGGFENVGSTGFGLATSDGVTIWSVGAEGGYFVMDDLAIKVGLGYADFDGDSIFSYKFGGKYYVIGAIPVQVDITGSTIDELSEDPLWLGLQGGYAIFLSDNISLEPGIRYNVSLNEDYTDEGIFEIRIGFVLFF